MTELLPNAADQVAVHWSSPDAVSARRLRVGEPLVAVVWRTGEHTWAWDAYDGTGGLARSCDDAMAAAAAHAADELAEAARIIARMRGGAGGDMMEEQAQ